MHGKDYIRHLFLVYTTQEHFTDLEGDGGMWLSLEDAHTRKYTTDVMQEFREITTIIQNL